MKSDMEELMPRLLPVEFEGSAEQLDLNGPPRNPREYLRQVQLEASLCPEVVVAQIDPKKLKKKQTVNASVAGCHAAPAGFSPSLSWQQQQVGNFSDVRQSIAKNRKHWSSQSLDDNVMMPKLTDDEGWKRFCLGEKIYLGASSDHTDTEPELALDYSKIGFPPFLSIVSRLNQSTVLMVLEVLISWFEEHEFTPQLGRWLYALLACLEKPLLPEAHSCIRQLARRCAQLRSSLVKLPLPQNTADWFSAVLRTEVLLQCGPISMSTLTLTHSQYVYMQLQKSDYELSPREIVRSIKMHVNSSAGLKTD